MGFFSSLFGGSSDDEPRRDRYGNDRENAGGPKVKVISLPVLLRGMSCGLPF